MKLYGRINSSNVAKVRWTLDHLALPYERVDVGGAFGGNDAPAFLEKNPNGLVPVLEDGGATLWESNAIVRYLASRYGARKLDTSAPEERARADAWMDWASMSFYPRALAAFRIATGLAGSADDLPAAIEAARKPAGILDAQLQHRIYVMGEVLSTADIAVGVHVGRFLKVKPLAEQYPAISRYHQSLLDSAAYRRNVEEALLG